MKKVLFGIVLASLSSFSCFAANDYAFTLLTQDGFESKEEVVEACKTIRENAVRKFSKLEKKGVVGTSVYQTEAEIGQFTYYCVLNVIQSSASVVKNETMIMGPTRVSAIQKCQAAVEEQNGKNSVLYATSEIKKERQLFKCYLTKIEVL